MSADALLEKIEQQGLLETSTIANLRRQVAQSGGKATAEAIVKLLVDNGQLTAFQGKKLLAETAGGNGEAEEELTELVELTGDDELVEEAGLTPQGLAPMGYGDPLMDAASMESNPMGMPGQPGQYGMPAPGGMAAPPGQAARQQGKYVPKAKRNPWESTLMFVGGGALVLLLLLGGVLYLTLSRGSSAEMIAKADEAYKNEQYLEAKDLYTKFLESYPDDENASHAKVRSRLAQLRNDVKSASNNWKRPLESARKLLPEIENEPKFAEARDELAAILPQIAEGFATQAQESDDLDKAEQQVNLAEEAMELVNNPVYIPTTLRKAPGTESRIEQIQAAMATVRRNISRERDLTAAVESIEKSAGEGDTAAAYQTRDELLKKYPGLESSKTLADAVRVVSQKQRDLVEVDTTPVDALTDEAYPPPEFCIVLAGRSGETAASAEGATAVVRARGAVYGLDAASGRVQWRRYVGHEPAPFPLRLGAKADAGVLAADGRSHELLYLELASGKLIWRLPLGEPFARPLVTDNGVLAAAASGKLYLIEPASGIAVRHAVLPQSVSVPPAADPRQPLCYQLADHTNLFVLSLPELDCKAAYYLGHKPGTVATAPVVLRGYVLVAENTGSQSSRLTVISTGQDGASLKRLTVDYNFKGRVIAQPVVYGSRVLVTTDLGATHVFEVDPTNKKSPVAQIAVSPATESQPVVAYALAHEGQFFVGDRRLTKYEIQTSRGELIRRWPKYEGDEFVAPLEVFGDVVIHARRQDGATGVTVAASSTDDGREIWRTELASPLAGEAFADGARREFVALTSSGQLFVVSGADAVAGLRDQPSGDVGVKEKQAPTFATRFDLGGGRLAFASQPPDTRVAYYEPGGAKPLQLLATELPKDSLSCPAELFEGGLLLPSGDGRIYLVDPATGSSKALPFQPALAPGEEVKWQRPALVAGGKQFVAADNRRRLYAVELQPSPKPHLADVKKVDLELDIVSPLAAVDQTVFGVVRGRASDSLARFSASGLEAGEEIPLEGRVVWGPQTAGDALLLATDRAGLICIGGDGAVRWKSPLESGSLAGAPLAENGDLLLALTSGEVRRIDSQTAAEKATLNLGEPLGAGPVAFGQRLLLTGSDGTLYVVSLPAPAS